MNSHGNEKARSLTVAYIGGGSRGWAWGLMKDLALDGEICGTVLDYPEESEELRMTRNMLEGKTADTVESVMTAEDVLRIREQVSAVTVRDEVIRYARGIAEMTRSEKRFVLGASPRAVLALVRASQAKAFLGGYDFVRPDDIRAVAPHILSHRLSLTSEAKIAKEDKDDILRRLIRNTKLPL